MSIYDLKPKFQAILRPLSGGCAKAGISANMVTLAALLLSGLWGYFFFLFPKAGWVFWSLPFVLFVRMALNAMDGIIAREYGTPTTFGMYFNEASDIIADIVIYVPLMIATGVSVLAAIVVAFFIVLAEVIGALPVLYARGKRRYEGPMGKSDRAFAFGLFALLFLVFDRGEWTRFFVDVIVILTILTIWNRMKGVSA